MFADDTVLYLGGSTVLTLSKGEQGALAPWFFFLYFGFSLSLKTNTFKFQ